MITSTAASSTPTDVPPSQMRLYLNDKGADPLPDVATISDHDIGNDAVLYVVFRKEGAAADDEDGWESIDVVSGDSGE